jgi:hypothetical protein
MKTLYAVITLCLFSCVSLIAQPSKFTTVEDADEHFKHGNFFGAIPIYTKELKQDPDNSKIKYRLGLCYLNTHIDRGEAVRMLELASKDPKVDLDVWKDLAKAYSLANRLEEAISSYEKYIELNPKKSSEVDLYINQCKNAIKMMRRPSNVSFQNLGQEINSTEPDYYPYIDKDEMCLAFTSRRIENFGGKRIEMDGYRSSDIYVSKMNANGHWSVAKNAGRALNTNLDEQVTGLKSDGLEIYVYMDHIDKFGDIYISSRPSQTVDFGRAKRVDESVNEKIVTSGCVSEDGSLLIFARRDKISENSDLYISRKLPNGNWGASQKLPDIINSPYNEDLPYLSYDGETLYFSNDGPNSMGGHDLFKSHWDQKTNTFSKPENLGYPINSTDDDKSICVTSDNRLAYVSSFRPNGYGDLDIYRIKFEDIEPVSVIYTGQMYMSDTIPSHQPDKYSIQITVTNTSTSYEYSFVPHSKTGRYMMALPAGKYKLLVQSAGYKDFEEDISVSDMGKINMERNKDIILKKTKKTK